MVPQTLYFSQLSTFLKISRTVKLSQYLCTSTRMDANGKPRVYVTRRVPMSGIEFLKPHFEITQWNNDAPVPQAELVDKVKDMDALFCLLTDMIDKEVIAAAGPKLKVIGTMSVGYDHIDLQTCKAQGIPVGFTPDVLTDATAELTVTLLLTVARRIVEGIEAVKSGAWGTWAPLWMCGPTLSNSTVGIIGLGRIGMAVAKRLQPFGVSKFLYFGRSPKTSASEISAEFVPIDELLAKSDFVIVTCALTEETKSMFNKHAFEKMKKSAIFVNTSRGGIVNQEDLHDALVKGEILAAGLDVTVPEPLPTDSPLLKLPNCVVLPHIGSATNETRSEMSLLCARNILAAIKGEKMPAQVKM